MQGTPIEGSDYCYAHHPDYANEPGDIGSEVVEDVNADISDHLKNEHFTEHIETEHAL